MIIVNVATKVLQLFVPPILLTAAAFIYFDNVNIKREGGGEERERGEKEREGEREGGREGEVKRE